MALNVYGSVDPVTLSFSRNGCQTWHVDAARNLVDYGYINQAEFSTGEPLHRVIAHWINLPEVHGNEKLSEETGKGRAWWTGRLSFNAAGWDITIDRRRDYSDVAATTIRENVYAITHVMELKRSDRKTFTHDEAKALIENLRVAFSFALSRWVAPTLPVGFSAKGDPAWESWTGAIADPLQKTGNPLLYQFANKDILKFLIAALEALDSEGKNGPLRFQMVSATVSSQGGFTEQRIATAFAALENLAWVTLVKGGHVTRPQFESEAWTAARKLKKMLSLARISPSLHGLGLSALETYSNIGRRKRNGPEALVKLRNALVHPRSPRDEIYHVPGLMTDAWLLSRYYLNFLVLHAVGYDGDTQVQLPMGGWHGETRTVPWAHVRP